LQPEALGCFFSLSLFLKFLSLDSSHTPPFRFSFSTFYGPASPSPAIIYSSGDAAPVSATSGRCSVPFLFLPSLLLSLELPFPFPYAALPRFLSDLPPLLHATEQTLECAWGFPRRNFSPSVLFFGILLLPTPWDTNTRR